MLVFRLNVVDYRGRGVKLHVANSGAVLNGVGTDFDFIRPGISLYGLPPGNNVSLTETQIFILP